MTEEVKGKPVPVLASIRARLLAVLLVAVALVGPAMAAISFANITEVIDAVVTLLPSFMDLAIAAAPVIITIAIIAFVVGFLRKILGMLGIGGMH